MTESARVLDRAGFDELFEVLAARIHAHRADRAPAGGRLRRDRTAARPARGVTDEQDGGTYRIARGGRRGPVLAQRRPQLVEEPPVPADAAPVARPRDRRRRPGGRGGPARRPAHALHRRALVRPARDRGAGPHLPRGRATWTATTRRGERSCFIVAVNCGQAASTCFCVSMGTGPTGDSGFDLALTEVARRGRAPLPGRGGQRARRRGARRAADAPARPVTTSERRAEAGVGRAATSRSASSTPRTSRTCSTATSSTRAGTTSPTAACRAATARRSAPPASAATVEDVTDLAGEHAEHVREWDSCFSLEHSLHARRQRALHHPLALPPVDDPQAGHLDRPVRHLRLHRLRPLHHVVPGGDRHHRGGGRDPGDRRRGLPMRTIDQLLAEVPAFDGHGSRAPRADRRLRRQPRASPTASYLAREGERADTFYVVREGAVALETDVPPARRAGDRDAPRARPRRLVVARAALPHRVRRARGRR